MNAKDFGFLPTASATDNYKALQRAANARGEIVIDTPGVYEIDRTVVLHSDTHLHFSDKVTLKRVRVPADAPYLFINAGAYTKECDSDISITGLRYSCNGHDIVGDTPVPGLRGHLSFFYIKHLEIRDFVCTDLEKEGFCIYICTFDDIKVEKVHIEGEKDAVHLGNGQNFVIRDGRFRTFDDPIALNAHDYSSSNPQLGWIENGLIEHCYDLDEDQTTGFFCRILAGSWCDWREGMTVQNSDSVVSGGRVYRVMMPPDGTVYTSKTKPTHKEGVETLDGIKWVMIQETVTYSCGCRNIHFKDIHLQKKRPVAFSIHFDHDNWSRSVYPDSDMPVQERLTFEQIYVENDIQTLLKTITPVRELSFCDFTGEDVRFVFEALPYCRENYPTADIKLSGYQGKRMTVDASIGGRVFVENEGAHTGIATVGDVQLS